VNYFWRGVQLGQEGTVERRAIFGRQVHRERIRARRGEKGCIARGKEDSRREWVGGEVGGVARVLSDEYNWQGTVVQP